MEIREERARERRGKNLPSKASFPSSLEFLSASTNTMDTNNINQMITRAEEDALRQRFDAVRARLEGAVAASGRSAGDVRLVAVSKWHSLPSIVCVARHWNSLGEKAVFSENYAQEALAKQEALAGMPEAARLKLEWHFTGHLQSKKAKQVVGGFSLIHTLDTLSLAQNLQKILEKQAALAENHPELAAKQPVLIQINLGREASKSGLDIKEIEDFFKQLQQFNLLDIQGLMCLPPYSENAEESRPYFAALRQIRDDLQAGLGIKLPHLSMGMSHDFEVAVQEGATLVRVGTDIFGPRQY